ncbi:spore coat protein JB [Anaerobacterium chartisolvens]|uniref:Spore coat protein JB n=1 Tax=Anaerobacterium chartisolvens TaxID=1297424 RepID=A0A369B0B5_9FIRM|nr:spore coat protein CotJB [Anaerobacterium chartisolvens]RCX13877.1 spore coat protein JB [Anaerobacterium chartisolvens]
MDNREKMLKEVMAADFTVIDLNLYLNTHPCEHKTIMFYNAAVQRAKFLRDSFERMYGPLTPFTCMRCPWPWIESPWPWEKQ